ncbi:MAG TPA: hypothetical protein VFU93_06375 [Acidimicrobiales bacterium]|nr:hypothetical protein [Acidimicrobiales bacterium]
MLECVVNVSEGRRRPLLDALAEAAGTDLLDLHADPHHNRAVLTLVGEEAPRRVASVAFELLDLRRHRGVHPRLGVVDVVPFVALEGSTMADAIAARDRYVAWSPVPCARYGPEGPTLPEVRRRAPSSMPAHPRAGITAVGARPVLVAYNVWLADAPLAVARAVAASLRSPALRAIGLQVGDRVQVSMNLVDPLALGPADAYDAVAQRVGVAGAELVGLVPRAVLEGVPSERWAQLDLGPDRTIEARLGR